MAPAPPPPTLPKGHPGRILVVDDVALNRLVVQALLESADYEVTLAGSGHEAIAMLAEASFDMVLMDVQMPEMSGLDATRHIRAAEASCPGATRAVIVALTGEDMEEEVRACLDAGMDAHLAKPADRASLLAMVRRMTGPANQAALQLSGAA
jgi:CheY-like chemotaxis protein